MMSRTQAIPMATQHLDTKDLLVEFEAWDPFLRHSVKREHLAGHRPGILEARGADALDFDA
jgi:hypothetical protein